MRARADVPRESSAAFALWCAGLAVAQLAWWLSIDAGPRIHYEHWGPVSEPPLRAVQWVALAVVGAWSAGVLARLARRRLEPLAGAVARVGKGPALAVLVVSLLPAAFPSWNPAGFACELAAGIAFRLVQLAALASAVEAAPERVVEAVGRGVDRALALGSAARGVDRSALAAAAFVVLVSGTLAVTSYERHPHVPDETAYLFHARYFAEGHLHVPAPPVPEAFAVYLMPCDAQGCYSPVPPGWPAVLALGVLAGVPWLVNPVLGGLSVLLLFALVRRLYDRRTARLAAWLLALSPWHLLVSMSLMTHSSTLAFTLAAALAVVAVQRGGALGWALLGGAAIGMVSLVRPLEGLAVASVLGLAALLGPSRYARLLPPAVLGLGALVVGALVLPYNAAMTGDPRTFPIMAYADAELGPGANSLGFGPDKGVSWNGLDPFPGHGLRDVVANAALNSIAIDEELHAWPFGSLAAIALLFALRRARRIDLVFAGAAGVMIGLQSLYWYSGGPDFAARYWYLVIAPCVVLSARGIAELAARADGGSTDAPAAASGQAASRVWLAAALATAVGTATFVPWRAVDKYHHFRGMRGDVRALLDEIHGPALVFVRGEDHPDLASAMAYNPLDPAAPVPLFAHDLGPAVRERLRAAYPERPSWLVDGPTRTGDGYRVVAGPVPPGAPLVGAGEDAP